MVKFKKEDEKFIKNRINGIFSLLVTIIFCMGQLLQDDINLESLLYKLIIVILSFWFVIGKIFSNLLYILLKEIIEDQVEVEEDNRRRREVQEVEMLEKKQDKEPVQKVKF